MSAAQLHDRALVDGVQIQSEETLLLLDPRLDLPARRRICEAVSKFSESEGAVVVASSGSGSKGIWPKRLVVLSRAALYESAHAVNRHLEVSAKDIWFLPLPDFHVGGLGVHVRAARSDSQVVRGPGSIKNWHPGEAHAAMIAAKATLTVLVPTQVFDLVAAKLRAPACLRAVVVGGQALDLRLFKAARELGWPLLPSYGCTECSSQIATASLRSLMSDDFPSLYPLSHVTCEAREGILWIKSAALLTAYLIVDQTEHQSLDPKIDGWFRTGDRGAFDGEALVVSGREDRFLKVAGEGVDLLELQRLAEQIAREIDPQCDVGVVALPEERRGWRFYLALANSLQGESIAASFNRAVVGVARAHAVVHVEAIPRTALGKLRYQTLRQLVQAQVAS